MVEGIVQGVGFRHFTRNVARRLGLSGYVQNLPDGRVEAAAEGDAESLRLFEESLRQGPAGARVSAVQASEEKEPLAVTGFSVR